jgi:hypothetical protein
MTNETNERMANQIATSNRRADWLEHIVENVLNAGVEATVKGLEMELEMLNDRVLFIRKTLKRFKPNKSLELPPQDQKTDAIGEAVV